MREERDRRVTRAWETSVIAPFRRATGLTKGAPTATMQLDGVRAMTNCVSALNLTLQLPRLSNIWDADRPLDPTPIYTPMPEHQSRAGFNRF